MRRVIVLGLTIWVWCVALGQAQAGPWLFTADEKKSKFDIEVTLDLGLVKESDDDSTRVKGTIIAELEPDEDPETIRITHVDAQPTKSKLQLKYSFGPFGIFGKANFTMTDFRIMLEPEDAGEAVELDKDGNFDIDVRDIQPLAFRGKASDNAWSSCASCHDDGHSDNVTWIFPTGPRQTIALEGTFANSDPRDQRILNWNAVRGSVTDFNNNSRGVQGGIGHATDVGGVNRSAEIFNHGPTSGISDALDAMTEWVATAVRAPIMPAPDSDAEYTGRQLFAANCSSCHGGEKWTKSSVLAYQNNPTFAANPLAANFFAQGRQPALDPNLTVAGPQIVALAIQGDVLRLLDDVGTRDGSNPLEIRGAGAIGGGLISIPGDPNEGVEVSPQSTQGFASLGGAGFNVPSLLGVAYHAPYLHDGSAATLEEVFDRHRLPQSGGQPISSVISDADDLEYLKAFLLSIDDETQPF